MLYLASQSPRRRQLLEQIGESFSVLRVDVSEQRSANESPVDYVSRVARDKARAGLASLADSSGHRIIGADTEVVLGDEVFGKPVEATSAGAMLRRLSGRTHTVISAVWLVAAEREQHALCLSRVRFTTLDTSSISAYIATGEPFGKAGGYAIQGRGAAFIEHLEGSYSGVMGLPLLETARLLQGDLR